MRRSDIGRVPVWRTAAGPHVRALGRHSARRARNHRWRRPIAADYRTSPTNIGLYMLSTVVAAKAGYIEKNEALERLRQTVETLKKLPKYTATVRGRDGKEMEVQHLYNWYSIDRQPKEIG